jgi:hypothetical protein
MMLLSKIDSVRKLFLVTILKTLTPSKSHEIVDMFMSSINRCLYQLRAKIVHCSIGLFCLMKASLHILIS